MKKHDEKLPVRIAMALDLPPSDFEGGGNITMLGNREAIIEGCRGITDYSQTQIKLAFGKFQLKISGERLYIKNMDDDCAHIYGNIFAVEFCR